MSDVKCPYCAEHLEDDQMRLLQLDRENEVECWDCKKRFIVEAFVTYIASPFQKETPCQN